MAASPAHIQKADKTCKINPKTRKGVRGERKQKNAPKSYGYIAEFSSAPLMASHIGIDVKLLTAILAFSHLDNCLPF